MNNYNWLIAELLVEQRARELAAPRTRVEPEPAGGGGVRRALASAFVRLGLRLDPAAGERLSGLALSPQGRQAR